jgi:hypothetical protein
VSGYSLFEDGMPVINDEIVIDPQVPEEARHALSAARARLIPYRQPAPPKPAPPAPVTGRRALIWGVAALVFLIAAVLAGASGSIGYVALLLIVAGVATAVAVLSGFARTRAGREWAAEQWNLRHARVYWHGQYIVPETDLDEEARRIWARAVAAANEIGESYVVQAEIVDSVRVAVDLPQRVWEIAEGLAALFRVRDRQREILRQDGSDAEQVAAKVSAQERTMMAEARRLEGRVRKLEEIADLMRKADAVKRPEVVVDRLGEVDDLLGELRARSVDLPPDLDPAERLRVEAQAVIDQANEAARNLAFPHLGEEDDDGNDTGGL